MNFTKLKQIDSSLSLLNGSGDEFSIKSISHSDCPDIDTFCFVKNNRFLKNIGRRSVREKFENTGIILLGS